MGWLMGTINWNKYTVSQWLTQFGLWCDRQAVQGGNMPYGLHINNIYWLMQEAKSMPSGKCKPLCEITDAEAYAVNAMLCKALKNKDAALAIECLIEHKVQGKSVRLIAKNRGLTTTRTINNIECAIYFLMGQNQLRISNSTIV
nr:MAG TPA: Protein of unknown function (DUF1133) [Caudoviricetes sp.]